MPASFDYAVVRVVPRVEREEFINVGALLFCPDRDFLAASIELDVDRLTCLFSNVDVELVREHLEALRLVCVGGAAAGPIGLLRPRERWHWLVAPRSTIIQTSAPHVGLCDDPARALERVLDANVRFPS
ncbi:MAG: DUF3037 domain-containing protein [Labilithrix sp.]|nr:DUF3037 domain-containing protein [Labilithrix sp.]